MATIWRWTKVDPAFLDSCHFMLFSLDLLLISFCFVDWKIHFRNCIGSRFGMMQSRIGLIILLKNFEFSLSPKTVEPISFIPKSFVLSPAGGMYLKLKAIN